MATAKIIDMPAQEPAPPEGVDRWTPDDDNLALEIVKMWEGNIRFFHGNWKLYENGVWLTVDSHEVKKELRQFLRRYRKYGVNVTQRRISGLVQMLEDDLYIRDRAIEAVSPEQEKYIPFKNGLFNLETYKLEDPRPDLYFTVRLDFDYDESAMCPTFLGYLNSSLVAPDGKTDWQLVSLAKQAIAYSMTARTDMKSSFWLVGKPDSGKSTFVAFLRSLMGELFATVDLNQLGVNRFLLAGLIGKRVVAFTEASAGKMLDEALFKSLVGGEDEVYADVKNRPAITFRPRTKLWWAMNQRPRISDRSGATFNRLHIIPFNRSIPADKRVHNLVQLLANERAGIFNDILPYYVRLCNSGKFYESDQSLKLREEYELENDTEKTYYMERLIEDPRGRVQADPLLKDYRVWCSENGFTPKNKNQMRPEWERLGLTLQKSGGLHYWCGAKLKSSE